MVEGDKPRHEGGFRPEDSPAPDLEPSVKEGSWAP